MTEIAMMCQVYIRNGRGGVCRWHLNGGLQLQLRCWSPPRRNVSMQDGL